MGVSRNEHAARIVREVCERDPHTLVDVGMGEGSYGNFLRGAGWRGHLIGVEVWAPYVYGQRTRALGNMRHYDQVVIGDIRHLVGFVREQLPDLVLMVDVLEHLHKSDGLVVLEELRAGAPVLVCVPIVPYPQDAIEGNPFERHLYDWTPEQLAAAGGRELARATVTGLYWFERR